MTKIQSRLAATAVCLLLLSQPAQASAQKQTVNPAVSMVVLGEGGAQVARAITQANHCPDLIVDGSARKMRERRGPSTEPQRITASSPELSKPSAFPVRVCEAVIPKGSWTARINGQDLPLVRNAIRRIVVIGDTGCRLKAKDNAWQACGDPAAFPFARIAARAADWHPDAVLHVGDYLYRENPCPEDRIGCAGSPWGYGWDSWDADFFSPAAPLLKAAPWILVRGNHESCNRGGQGWWRFLDPRPLTPGRDCDAATNDRLGDVSPAYAVPLGHGAQVVVMDLSNAGISRLEPGDPRISAYSETWRALDAFARKARFTFAADHYPVFGVAAAGGADANPFKAGNAALQGVFGAMDSEIMPRAVDVLLAGHIHLWEQVDFGGRLPSQFVTGFSGTQEEVAPLPIPLPASVTPAAGVPIRRFDAMTDVFGYMTLERTGQGRWIANVYAVNGANLKRCSLSKRRSFCSNPGLRAGG